MLKKILNSLISCIFPSLCISCGRKTEENILCKRCLEKIEFLSPPLCKMCSQPLKKKEIYICNKCKGENFFYDQLISAVYYKEPIISLVHLFKYNYYDFLGEFFSSLIVKQLNTLGFNYKEFDFITNVPSHPVRIKERDYSPTKLLAYQCAQKIKIPFQEVLICKYLHKSQTKLSFRERQTNVKGVFESKDDVKGKKIILIDDIVTTKATLSECSKVLKEKGAKYIVGLTLAKSYENYS